MIKKLICLGFILALVACSSGSTDDSKTGVSFEILPIESAIVPSSFSLNQTYQIRVLYYRPSNCHAFSEFYFEKQGSERVVAIINSVIDNINCEALDNDLIEVLFNFVAEDSGTYLFKFWQGFDQNGNDQYYIVEVPVLN
jgi:hypothetical protein